MGIDLGTTHTVAAYLDSQSYDPEETPPTPEPVCGAAGDPAWSGRSAVAAALVPVPGRRARLSQGALDLPWSGGKERTYVVGELARQHGSLVPLRLVSSAKSWLCYDGVDRTAAILPHAAPQRGPDAVPKVSPSRHRLATSATCAMPGMRSLRPAIPRRAWPIRDVFLTVPASFDAVARELTVRAAQAAGLAKVTLLEEPQAAFYDWLGRHSRDWRAVLRVGDTVLVCDIGGGTTDFSLISVGEHDGNLALERIAVGDHILLGGDNMDLALAWVSPSG